jgi:glycosyltransferase involved in cell wall biosynthesis
MACRIIICPVKVSLILTVLNEGPHLRRLLDSIAAQSRPPDEVVVCDGGSRDDTLALLQSYGGRLPLKVLSEPGANISRGRNAAIRAAAGPIIAVTDAGVWLEPDWLAELLAAGGWQSGAPQAEGPALAAGFFRSDPANTFEIALGAASLPDVTEIDPARFLPSSRSVAFRKEAWGAVGGYPEWLDYSEDVVFDLAVRGRFGPFAFAPRAVAHFRPRASLASFARQYFNYAKGDGRAGLWPRIHFVRYFTYLVAAPLGVLAALTVSPWLWLLGLLAGLAYLRRPLQRLARAGQLSPAALAWAPVIRVTGDLAKMAGYPVGVWQRLRALRGVPS